MNARRRRAVRAAYVGGVLLVLTGGSGAAAMVATGWRLLQGTSPELGTLRAGTLPVQPSVLGESASILMKSH